MRLPGGLLLGLLGAPWLCRGATRWEPHFLYDYPKAVCNDGSPAAYYYRPGDADRRQWLVFLEGAGWCWDVKSCAQPWHAQLGTSIEFPRAETAVEAWSRNLGGIFDESGESPFQGMHVAFVRACSNDAFMGDVGPQHSAGSSWHFRGKQIVDATFGDLRKRTGLGSQVGDRVVFGGCSSGARGATVLIDYVTIALTGLAEVVGLLDSGLWVPVNPHTKGFTSLDDQARQALSLFKPPDMLLGEECRKSYPKEHWKCMHPAYRLPFVSVPFFLSHSQYDLFAISMNLFGHFKPDAKLNPQQQNYANYYRSTVIKYLPTPLLGSGTTVFSSACYMHCSMASKTFYSVQASGVSLLDALRHWLASTTARQATRTIRDPCHGFDCGRHAPQAPPQPSSASRLVASESSPNEWQPRFLEEHPLAICNDGSPAAYYYREGTGHSRRWFVFLEGGGWCYDAESCNIPWKVRLATSIEFARTPAEVKTWSNTLKGAFDNSGRSPFKDWHMAYVRTCSNDAFMGDSSPREAAAAKRHEPGPGWHFRGRRILEAVFADLRKKSGLGDREGDFVLFGGCSSGGRGALVSLDYLAEHHVGKAKMVGVLDAPLWVPLAPLETVQHRSGSAPNVDLTSFETQTQIFFKHANNFAFISHECAATYPEPDLWKCLHPAYRLPLVHTPYFLAHSQYDVFGITMNIFGTFLPGHYLTPPQKRYAEKYRKEVLRRLPKPEEGSGVGVFAPACYVHCMIADVVFYIIDADGVLLKTALSRWAEASADYAATTALVDDCLGFACGLGRQRTRWSKGFVPRTVRATTTPRLPLLEVASSLLV